MNLRNKAVFSNDGEYFALITEQGSLKIWESASNTLKQDHILKSSLRFSCSSIIWGPYTNEFNITDKVDDHDSGTEQSDCQCIVVGTNNGEVLLYDFTIGKFYNHFIRAHDDAVTDLCWYTETSCVYSCSKDTFISIWDIADGKIKLKWKADDEPLQSLCVLDVDNVLCASTAVTWWNVKDQTVIKKFNNLGAEIFSILPVVSSERSSNSYFLTAVSNDSIINAWHLNGKKNDIKIASFDLKEELESMDVTRDFSRSSPMLLSAVLKSGQLILYQHVLNGKIRKDLSPLMKVHIVDKAIHGGQLTTIPIVASKISNNSKSCTIVYGKTENLRFEKIKTTDCPKTLTLTRCERKQNSESPEHSNDRLPVKAEDYTPVNGDITNANSVENCPKRSNHKNSHDQANSFSADESSHDSVEKLQTPTKSSVLSSPRVKKKVKTDELPHSNPITLKEEVVSPDKFSTDSSLQKCLETESTPDINPHSNPNTLKEEVESTDIFSTDSSLQKCLETENTPDINPHSNPNASMEEVEFPDNFSTDSSLQIDLETENTPDIDIMLNCSDAEVVRNSVKSFPKHKLKYILSELIRRFSSQSENCNSRKWLKEILKTHLRYFIENEDCSDVLDLIRNHLELQKISETISKIYVLKGILSLRRIQNPSFEESDCDETDQKMET